jgi:Na+-driven multidrug efflux pump
VFTEGSIFRHVLVMTLTSSVGLMAVFFIDLLSMFYVSMAHRDAWQAAVSLMSKVMFFPFALNMGMMIGVGTVVSVAIGRGHRDEARRLASTGLMLTAALGLTVALCGVPFRFDILRLFGADGEALDDAARLLVLVLPVNVLLAVGMACASILRAYGDPTRAMFVTLAGAVVIAAADPLFIFGLGQGVDGVGMAIVASRIIFVAVGLWGTVYVHRLIAIPRLPPGLAEIRAIAMIALPAMATNLALPFADWYVTRTIWQFGVGASAAAGVYDRIMPLAFSLVFALTTAIGPIAGQNLGARAFDRVRQTFLYALAVVGFYSLTVWVIVWTAAPSLAGAFGLSGGTGTFFLFLCRYATIAWVFVAFLLVANTIFNTLGRAHVSTLFNWGRATFGTMPFVWLGAHAGGPETAMLGIAGAAIVFAAVAVSIANNYTRRLGHDAPDGVSGSSKHDLGLTRS